MKDDKGFEKLINKVIVLRQQGIRYFQVCEDAIASGGPPPPLPVASDRHLDAVDTRTLSVEPDAIEMHILRTLHNCYGGRLAEDGGLKGIIRTFSIQGGRNLLHRMFMSDRPGDNRVRVTLDDASVPLTALFDKNPDYFMPDAMAAIKHLR